MKFNNIRVFFWCLVKCSGWAYTVCVFTSNRFEEDIYIFLRFWSTHLRKGGERKENGYHTMVSRDDLLVSVFNLVHLSVTGLLRIWIDQKKKQIRNIFFRRNFELIQLSVGTFELGNHNSYAGFGIGHEHGGLRIIIFIWNYFKEYILLKRESSLKSFDAYFWKESHP